MDINAWKQLSYEDVRHLYKSYLKTLDLSPNTLNTAYVDTFYIWRKGSHDLFWKTVEGNDEDAKQELWNLLLQNSSGDTNKLIGGYLSHLRRFRTYLESNEELERDFSKLNVESKRRHHYSDIQVPTPSKDQVEYYLAKWDEMENYRLQESALDKLFKELCVNNTDITDILLKVSVLNDFYSTNIFSVYPVAKHILSLDIDSRLKAGDVTLVNDIKTISINGTERIFYSFASKYCSHHNSLDYPIYDSYVDTVLRYFRNCDEFASFEDKALKNYIHFKGTLIDFRTFYGLDDYNLKQLDKYLWLLGKVFFPKSYRKKEQ